MLRVLVALSVLALAPTAASAAPRAVDGEALALREGMTSDLVTVHRRAGDGVATQISVSATRVDLRVVLRSLAKVSGVQVVIADDVPDKRITLAAERQTPQEVFYAVLHASGVAATHLGQLTMLRARSETVWTYDFSWPHGHPDYRPERVRRPMVVCY